ncbi:UNVERIFIED_CONTAM: hypothetical protein FKN15_040015 [Acipenser sinensis]
MVKRFAWRDLQQRHKAPRKFGRVNFILFPKPKTNFEKCVLWIKLCGRPQQDQLHTKRISKETPTSAPMYDTQYG